MQGLRFDVDTKPIVDAVNELRKLKTEIGNVNTAVEKKTKQAKESADAENKDTKAKEESAKALAKQLKFITDLDNKLKDIVDGYSRSEAAILKQARNLKLTGDQITVVTDLMKKLRPLISDPFDSSIGAIASVNKELQMFQNRSELAAQGITLTSKQLREFSRIQEEVYGKFAASSGNSSRSQIEAMPAFSAEVERLKTQYLAAARQVQGFQSAEDAAKGKGSNTVSYGSKGSMDSHVNAYRKANALNSDAYLSQQKQVAATEEAIVESHVLAMQAANRRREINEQKSNDRIIRAAEKRVNALKDQYAAELQEQELVNAGYSPGMAFANAQLELRRNQVQSKYSASVLASDPRAKALMEEELKLLDKQHEHQTKNAKSAKEMAFAMRQVPMQITDIVTSLAAGQPPMMVMLQQGGQLKDMFGGVKEAAIALAAGLKDALFASVGLLANPFVAAGVAIAAFSALLWKAADRNEEFAKSIILMGNSTTLTLADVRNAASSVAEVTGTSLSTSGNAFITLAKHVKLSNETLKELTITAVDLEKYGGQSVDKTAKDIAALRDKPLEAMLDLNKEIGFLTPELVKQAQAFVDNGQKADAAALLISKYNDAMVDMAKKLKENEGAGKQLWREVTESIQETIDKLSEFLLKYKGVILTVAKFQKDFVAGGPIGAIAGLFNNDKPEDKSPRSLSVTEAPKTESDKASAVAKLQDWLNKNNKKLKEKSERTELESMLNAAGASESDRKLAYASLNDKYKEKANKPSELYSAGLEHFKAMAIDESKSIEDANKANKLLEEQRKIQAAILHDQLRLSSEEDTRLETKAKLNTLSEKDKFIYEAKVKAEADTARLIERTRDNRTLSPDQIEQTVNDLIAKRPELVAKAGEAAAKYYDQERDFATGWEKAYNSAKDSAKDYAKVAENVFSKLTDSMADAMTTFVMTGKLSFKDLANSIIADLIRIQAKNLAVGLMGNSSSGIMGFLGGIMGSLNGNTAALSNSGYNSTLNTSGYADPSTLSWNANGNAFGLSGIQAFANGGAFTNSVVNSITPFKFANGGKFGIMGEAGPEAIMPLSRDSSGKLGVSVSGGTSSGSVSVIVNNQGNNLQVTEQKETVDSRGNRKIELTVSEMVAKEQSRPGSSIYNSTKSSFGLRPALVTR